MKWVMKKIIAVLVLSLFWSFQVVAQDNEEEYSENDNQNLQDLRKEVADLSVQVDEIQNNLQELRGRLEENQHSVDQSLKEIRTHIDSLEKNTSTGVSSSPPPTSGVTSPITPSPAALDPEVVYNDAYRIFQEGRYPESRSAFVKFLQQFPQTEFSDNAQFWIGEAYFKEGKTEEAILAFEDVVKKYPQGNKVPDALVRQGLCFKVLGDKDNARIILRQVIDKYPNTPQADMARNELEGLS